MLQTVCGASKLQTVDLQTINKLFADGMPLTQLASKYITPENKQEIWGEKTSNFQQVTRVILGENDKQTCHIFSEVPRERFMIVPEGDRSISTGEM